VSRAGICRLVIFLRSPASDFPEQSGGGDNNKRSWAIRLNVLIPGITPATVRDFPVYHTRPRWNRPAGPFRGLSKDVW